MKFEKIVPQDFELLVGLVDKMARAEGLTALNTRSASLVASDSHSARKDVEIKLKLDRNISAGIVDHWDDVTGDGIGLEILVEMSRAIVDVAGRVWDDREEIVEFVLEVRDSVKRELAKFSRKGVKLSLKGVTPNVVAADSYEFPHATVAVEVLDDRLKPKVLKFEVTSVDEVVADLGKIFEEQKLRRSLRDGLMAVGATGAIDAVVLASLLHDNIDVPELLRRMDSAPSRYLALKPGEGLPQLYWRQGTIHASLEIADGVRWHEWKLIVDKGSMKELRNLAGRLASEVVDSPLLPADMIVQHSTAHGDEYRLHVSPNIRRFDGSTGSLI